MAFCFGAEDLVVHIKDVSLLPEPERVVLPLKIAAGAAFQSIMLPHMVFHSLYSNYKAYWETTFLPGGIKKLQAFWTKIATHPIMDGHCLKSKDFWLFLEGCVVDIAFVFYVLMHLSIYSLILV